MILWAFQTIGCDGLSTERTLLFRGTTAMYLKKGPLMQRARCQYHQAGHMVMVPWCIFLAVVVPVVTAAYFPALMQETFTEIFFGGRGAGRGGGHGEQYAIKESKATTEIANEEPVAVVVAASAASAAAAAQHK